MHLQGGRIVLYPYVTSAESGNVMEQLADIGYADTTKVSDAEQLTRLVAECPDFTLLLLLSGTSYRQSDVPEVIEITRGQPVLGLFPREESCWDRQLIELCDEVSTWPCSKWELDFRLRMLAGRSPGHQDLGQRLFVNMQIMGNSPVFLQALDKVNKVTRCDAPVLIDGETGTGKELIGRAIHYLSERKHGPFIAVNCGAIPDQLVENEFFGHNKGAYTDAREASDGIIAQAEGGTLFLDEIEALSPKGQVTLLRFLDNMAYRPLGSKKVKRANLRIIAATNKSILQMVEDGSFRKDLYYRINIMNIYLPSLRDRTGDVNLLAEHFIRKFQRKYDQPDRELHPDTRDAMKYYDWPGNVRELENMLHREFLLADGKYIVIKELESAAGERRGSCCDRRMQDLFAQPMARAKSYVIGKFEQQYLISILEQARGNISEAARIAGKERRSFTRLLDKYHLGKVRLKPQ